MTPEAQRISIAQACGWTKIIPASTEGRRVVTGVKPGMMRIVHRGEYIDQISDIPDYLNDLNAMHEAEMTLTKEQGEAWAGLLCDMTDKFDGDAWKHAAYSLAHATAAQRAEAFLRAKGLWV